MKKKILFVAYFFALVAFVNADTQCYRVDVLGMFDFEYNSAWSIYREHREVESFYLLRDVGFEPWVGHNPEVSKIAIKIRKGSSSLEYLDRLDLELSLRVEEVQETEIDGHRAVFVCALDPDSQEQLLIYIIEIKEGLILDLTGYPSRRITEIASRDFKDLVQSIRFKD